jgi:DDE superfamily endonuclease
VRPGREHATTALRTHNILPPLTTWTNDDLRVLGDLGYEGEQATITVAFKKPKNRSRTTIEQQFNRAHNTVRAIGERGNSLLKTTFKTLRNVSLCPWTIGRITAAALVILHVEHGRTT